MFRFQVENCFVFELNGVCLRGYCVASAGVSPFSRMLTKVRGCIGCLIDFILVIFLLIMRM